MFNYLDRNSRNCHKARVVRETEKPLFYVQIKSKCHSNGNKAGRESTLLFASSTTKMCCLRKS
ncbi:MAG: hypothetical protein KI793_32190 [Rivularia sp. (in: Bacteria)]|nr:hypothetical protein [Rivularia sp. MS3]